MAFIDFDMLSYFNFLCMINCTNELMAIELLKNMHACYEKKCMMVVMIG